MTTYNLFLFAKQANPNRSQEVNGTMILPPLAFPGAGIDKNSKKTMAQVSTKKRPANVDINDF